MNFIRTLSELQPLDINTSTGTQILPRELIIEILGYCSIGTIQTFGMTNKKFQEFTQAFIHKYALEKYGYSGDRDFVIVFMQNLHEGIRAYNKTIGHKEQTIDTINRLIGLAPNDRDEKLILMARKAFESGNALTLSASLILGCDPQNVFEEIYHPKSFTKEIFDLLKNYNLEDRIQSGVFLVNVMNNEQLKNEPFKFLLERNKASVINSVFSATFDNVPNTLITPMFYSLFQNNTFIIESLWKANQDKEHKIDGKTFFMKALDYLWDEHLENKLYRSIIFMLILGVNVNTKDDEGNTPLMIALKKKLFDLASLLIVYGADIKAVNNNGERVVDIAVSTNKGRMIEFIFDIEQRCVYNKKNKFWFLVELNKIYEDTWASNLFYSSMRTNKDNIFEKTAFTHVLIHNGIINETNCGHSPLTYAIEKDHELTMLLIEKGADLHHKNNNGDTALQIAMKKNNPQLTEMIKKSMKRS